MVKHKKNKKQKSKTEKAPVTERPIPEPEVQPAETQSLEQVIEERDNYIDLLKRVQADFVNFRKRAEKEKQNFCKLALKDILLQLVPSLDDIRRGLESESQGTSSEQVLEGIKITFDKLSKVLQDAGLERVETVGAKFDPAFHEAVMQEFRDDMDDMTVCEELHGGYILNGTTILPAKVKVARKPQPPEKEESE